MLNCLNSSVWRRFPKENPVSTIKSKVYNALVFYYKCWISTVSLAPLIVCHCMFFHWKIEDCKKINSFFSPCFSKVAEVGDGNITTKKEGTNRYSFLDMHQCSHLAPRHKDYMFGLMFYCYHLENLKNFLIKGPLFSDCTVPHKFYKFWVIHSHR